MRPTTSSRGSARNPNAVWSPRSGSSTEPECTDRHCSAHEKVNSVKPQETPKWVEIWPHHTL